MQGATEWQLCGTGENCRAPEKSRANRKYPATKRPLSELITVRSVLKELEKLKLVKDAFLIGDIQHSSDDLSEILYVDVSTVLSYIKHHFASPNSFPTL